MDTQTTQQGGGSKKMIIGGAIVLVVIFVGIAYFVQSAITRSVEAERKVADIERRLDESNKKIQELSDKNARLLTFVGGEEVFNKFLIGDVINYFIDSRPEPKK
jgi:hypothetical protein